MKLFFLAFLLAVLQNHVLAQGGNETESKESNETASKESTDTNVTITTTSGPEQPDRPSRPERPERPRPESPPPERTPVEEEVLESDSGNSTGGGATTVRTTTTAFAPTQVSTTEKATTTSSLPEGATTKVVKKTVVTGTTTMSVAGIENPAEFIKDPDVITSVAAGLAKSLGVPSEYVEVTLSIIEGDSSSRRLQATSILVTHTITIPEDAPASVDVSALTAKLEAVASGGSSGGFSLASLSESILAEIKAAKPDVTITVTVTGVSAPVTEVVEEVVVITTSSSTTTTSNEPTTDMAAGKMGLAGAHLLALATLMLSMTA